VKLLGHHGVFRTGPQLWSRQIVEQHGIVHGFRCRRDDIAETDTHLQRNASAIQLRLQVDPHTAIARLLADFGAPERSRFERDAVRGFDLADLADSRGGGVDVVWAIAQQICVPRWPVWLVVSQGKQQGALEQVVGAMPGDRQPVQQPF